MKWRRRNLQNAAIVEKKKQKKKRIGFKRFEQTYVQMSNACVRKAEDIKYTSFKYRIYWLCNMYCSYMILFIDFYERF